MVKSVLGVNHQGLRDWAIQRVSAIFLAIYFLGLLGYFILHPQLSFSDWHGLFGAMWMKISTIILILCLLSHAWVGVWTIFTDYVPCYWLRSFLNVLVLLVLTACFFWGILILWSV